jgi:hypothetical protein
VGGDFRDFVAIVQRVFLPMEREISRFYLLAVVGVLYCRSSLYCPEGLS